MNRLAFGEFHQKHFGSEQTAYWSAMIQQQQQQQQHQQQQQQYEQYYPYDSVQTNEASDYAQDQIHNSYNELQQQQKHQNEYDEELSEEAIEIFRFSEAYRKEKELARLEAEREETEGMQDWQYDESSVHYSGGQEAPVTSLVLTKPDQRSAKGSQNNIQEELLNSAYLSSCRHDQVVFWPVIPFKL